MKARIPHFFKARSRIGLVNAPLGSDEQNIGVEDAPDAICDSSFLKKFPAFELSEFDFSSPENVPAGDFFKVLADELLAFRDFIISNLKKQEVQVVIGGDDCVTFSSLLATLERLSGVGDFGYIRVDSHADMNLFSTSPTGNFHGMYHRPLFDDFDVSEISDLAKVKLRPENALFVGNLNLDPEEKVFFQKKGFKNVTSKDFKNESSLSVVDTFVKGHDFLHVSIDIDGFDRSIAPATGIPAESGLKLFEILPVIEVISGHKKLSIDLVEVNPKKKGAAETVRLAQFILAEVLS